jgi:hypothetical protein
VWSADHSLRNADVRVNTGTGIAQSVQRRATGLRVWRSCAGGGENFRTIAEGSGVHPASCKIDAGSFQGEKQPGRGFNHPPQSNAEVNPLTLELDPSAQRCLTRFFIGILLLELCIYA